MFLELRASIVDRTAGVVVWGCGLLGTTNLLYTAQAGYNCLGLDVNDTRVTQIENHQFGVQSDQEVLGRVRATEEIRQRIHVTTDWRRGLDGQYSIHIICAPTERGGNPYAEPLIDVVRKIAEHNPDRPLLVLVESTVPPFWIDTYVLDILNRAGHRLDRNLFLGTAPRRDLFGDPGFSLRQTPRVIGAETSQSLELMEAFYRTYCDELVMAQDSGYAMMSKLVENMFRYQSITLANQLMQTLPDYDVTHILHLASTKWNMELYHPSLGIGGYCIPLAPEYLSAETKYRGDETPLLIQHALSYNETYVPLVYKRIQPLIVGGTRVALLGVSYIPNIKVPVGSIAIKWMQHLKDHGFTVGVHDPFIAPDELTLLMDGCIPIRFPDDLHQFDAIFILTDHDYYRSTDITDSVRKDCTVIDNFGTWRSLLATQVETYVEMGNLRLKGDGKINELSEC